jgi:hypothetical protein
LSPLGDGEQPAYRPCDWVSTPEAAQLLGAPVRTLQTGPSANAMGRTDVNCEYVDEPVNGIHTHDVRSELRLTGAHVVDAASEFAFKAGDDSTSVSGLGLKAVCTSPQRRYQRDRQLYVLLPGERHLRKLSVKPRA